MPISWVKAQTIPQIKQNRKRTDRTELKAVSKHTDRINPPIHRQALPVTCSMKSYASFLVAFALALTAGGCTQETQNKFGRAVQNWTGTDGVLEIYAGNQLVKRFMKIDKLTTASATGGDASRPYRFGYGVLDTNLNGVVDAGEKKVYFEFSDYSTPYIFYENPD